MQQKTLNSIISVVGAAVIALLTWALSEINSQGKILATVVESNQNMEAGFGIMLKKIDEHSDSINDNANQIGRNVDRILRNEIDIRRNAEEN